ncbi:MAG: hypothetical protein QOI31_2586 [Solirubrobacterales bacterium]|jgi:hypothetical protein|nr:hypothetical protein [Solirubrobacterales bacterium]
MPRERLAETFGEAQEIAADLNEGRGRGDWFWAPEHYQGPPLDADDLDLDVVWRVVPRKEVDGFMVTPWVVRHERLVKVWDWTIFIVLYFTLGSGILALLSTPFDLFSFTEGFGFGFDQNERERIWIFGAGLALGALAVWHFRDSSERDKKTLGERGFGSNAISADTYWQKGIR